MQYLRKAPTLIVIGVAGYVAWPIMFAERDSGPPKPTTKPPVTAKPSISVGSVSLRDPFQLDRSPGSNSNLTPVTTSTPAPAPAPVTTPSAGSSASLAALKSGPGKEILPALAADEDKILAGMRLVGTFIDDREKLAVIDNKVYARGDQLRRPDGSPLPYVVTEVRKDRALVRRGRRDFVIAFSDVPGTAGPKAIAPAQSKGMAKAETGPGKVTAAKPKGPVPGGQPSAGSGDPKQLILQMLSGLGGSSPGSSSIGGSGAAGSLSPSSLGVAVNANTISAGLDALMGKLDSIGRTGDGSTPSNPAGGTEP